MHGEQKDPSTLKLTTLVMGSSDRVMYGLGPEGEIVRVSDPMSAGPMTFTLLHDPEACEAAAKEKAEKEKAKKDADKTDGETVDTKSGAESEVEARAKSVGAKAKAAEAKKDKPKEVKKPS